jgi:NTE family protein
MRHHQPAPLSGARATSATTGLLLTGGGARAAYQVGVLEALSDIHCSLGRPAHENPFGVITGTSAGAINAAALASHADDFRGAVRRLVTVWEGFHAHQVYRADALGVVRSGARWLGADVGGLGRWPAGASCGRARCWTTAPLAELLQQMVPLERLPGLVEGGHLRGLAVSAPATARASMSPSFRARPSCSHGHARSATGWQTDHPPASAGVVGDSVRVSGQGAVHTSRAAIILWRRLHAAVGAAGPGHSPGRPALLVIGAGRMHEPRDSQGQFTSTYPSLAQIAGHALSNIFLDALSVDVERVQRINHTLS